MDEVRSAAESVFRRESGRIVAALIRMSGSFDRAEEAMQEAFAAALAAWTAKGLPDNPAAWIMTAAHRKLIDGVRRDRIRQDKQEWLAYDAAVAQHTTDFDPDLPAMDFPDDRLRLIFTCCHPALNRAAQVGLTLRTLGGLTTPEIAKAFLLPEPTLAQRLVRARRKIQEARIPYEVPRQDHLPRRLASVQAVVYLIFNEGYAASSGSELVRSGLCGEAIHLGRMLCHLMPGEAENRGLLALMLLHHSRRDARVGGGKLITLEEQDRSLWDRDAIREGLDLLADAAPAGPYALQAAIAAVHARAPRAGDTDWSKIAGLYEQLYLLSPSPVIALNLAVAIAMCGRLQEGLERIDELGARGALDRYYLLYAARADLLRRLGRNVEAASAYREAAALAPSPLEVEFLERRLSEVLRPSAGA